MKKCISILLSIVLALGIGATLAGCDGNTQDSGGLNIVVYNGGYGVKWAEKLAEKFSEENGGVVVNVIPNNGVLTTLTAELKDKKNTTDLYFSHGISWEMYAAEGLIEPLDDLYASEVENGKTFEERVIPKALAASKFNNHYYKMPWTQGAGGLVYNVKMFEENKWEIPTTYAQLVQTCKDIVASDKKYEIDGVKKTVAPFIWSGTDSWIWDYLVFEWWGQLAGTEKIEGLMNYTSPEVFNPETNWKELKQAYQYWYDLIALNPEFSHEGSAGTSKFTAQSVFVQGGAAMMVNANWLYNETKASAKSDFEMEMIPAPQLPDAKEGYEKVNFSVGFGDSAILASRSKHKETAKDFLRFLAREENCLSFSEDVPGTALAFDYDMKKAAPNNKFAQSVATMHKECKSFNIYSTSQLVIVLGSEKIGPWLANKYYYVDSFSDTKGDYTPDKVFENVYTYATANWKNWCRGAGITYNG